MYRHPGFVPTQWQGLHNLWRRPMRRCTQLSLTLQMGTHSSRVPLWPLSTVLRM